MNRETPPTLKIAVVGHTNTGKTSLMRTLMRDVSFGEVSDRPATTRHVEGATLLVNGQPLIELYDTPGLEDSSALLEHMNSQHGAAGVEAQIEKRRTDWIDQVRNFLASPEAHGRFAQEAKALRQVLASDVALYVIDARDRVLGKHRDELEILARCCKPVVPVLNFVASPEAQTALWREHLSRANMHAVAEFDTVVLDEHSERRLLEKIRTLADHHQQTINALIDDLQQQRARLVTSSADLVADLLIDVAAHAVTVPTDDPATATAAIEAFKQRIRDREQQCVEQLLELHRFRVSDFVPQAGSEDLPLTEGRWALDLFSPAAMKQFGVRTGSAAAAGAVIGLSIDAVLHGVSLGAATAIGAGIGALLGMAKTHGKRIFDQARGYAQLRADDATLRLLMIRQLSLIHTMLRRGHASLAPIQVADSAHAAAAAGRESKSATRIFLRELEEARIRPQWSRLTQPQDHIALSSSSRRVVQNVLAETVVKVLQGGDSRRSTNGLAR